MQHPNRILALTALCLTPLTNHFPPALKLTLASGLECLLSVNAARPSTKRFATAFCPEADWTDDLST